MPFFEWNSQTLRVNPNLYVVLSSDPDSSVYSVHVLRGTGTLASLKETVSRRLPSTSRTSYSGLDNNNNYYAYSPQSNIIYSVNIDTGDFNFYPTPKNWQYADLVVANSGTNLYVFACYRDLSNSKYFARYEFPSFKFLNSTDIDCSQTAIFSKDLVSVNIPTDSLYSAALVNIQTFQVTGNQPICGRGHPSPFSLQTDGKSNLFITGSTSNWIDGVVSVMHTMGGTTLACNTTFPFPGQPSNFLAVDGMGNFCLIGASIYNSKVTVTANCIPV